MLFTASSCSALSLQTYATECIDFKCHFLFPRKSVRSPLRYSRVQQQWTNSLVRLHSRTSSWTKPREVTLDKSLWRILVKTWNTLTTAMVSVDTRCLFLRHIGSTFNRSIKRTIFLALG